MPALQGLAVFALQGAIFALGLALTSGSVAVLHATQPGPHRMVETWC